MMLHIFLDRKHIEIMRPHRSHPSNQLHNEQHHWIQSKKDGQGNVDITQFEQQKKNGITQM